MTTHDEWDQQDAGVAITTKEAAIALARSLGKDEAVQLFEQAVAVGVQGELAVILPQNRLESLKHGKGWARRGEGPDATWGAKVSGGYRVNRPGRWVVGGNDGFERKREDEYVVSRVKIGDLFWIVAMSE